MDTDRWEASRNVASDISIRYQYREGESRLEDSQQVGKTNRLPLFTNVKGPLISEMT
jgi:hypothetical protein